MRKWALIVAAVFAACGVVVASISVSQHLRIAREGFERASFCAISEKINCDIVNASSYSQFLGVPVAAWGITFYAIIFVLSLISYFPKRDMRQTAVVGWLMSCGGIAYSLYLAYIAGVVLGVVCIECLTLYLINILIFVFLFAALGVRVRAFAGFMADYIGAIFGKANNLSFRPNFFRHAVAIAIVFVIGWGIAQAAVAKEGPAGAATVDEKIKAFYMQSLYSIEPDENWTVWGNPNAKVTVVEFSDFQCPFCKVAAFKVRPYLSEFKNDIRFYFVNYPLDQACNENMEHPMHEYACFAAKASMCAAKKGDFWGFHDDLFRNQKGINNDKILAMAEKRGWDRAEFEACINSPEALEQVKKDIAAGKAAHIDGTPAIFVDNRIVRYWPDSDFLQELIKKEIKRVK